MNRSKIFAAALVAVMTSGTLAADANARSKSYCRAYAEDVADHRTGAQQVVGGAVGGAVAGGVIGALIGGKRAVGTGIVAGGVTGGVLGSAHASKKWERIYWRAYEDCRR